MSGFPRNTSTLAKDFKRVWEHRSLIINFAWTDLKSRYRNTYLGFLWSLIQPLAWFTILYVIFTVILERRTEDYLLYLLLGVLMYHAFSRGTSLGGNSIVHRANVFRQVPLPLEIPALSAVISSSISMIFELSVYFVFMVALQFIPPITIFLLPPVLLLETILIFAISLPLSAITVFHRDLQNIWGIMVHLGFWLTPITYRYEWFPSEIRLWLSYIPIGGIIDLGHVVALGTETPPMHVILYTIAVPFVILFAGYAIFKKLASRVVEEI